MSGWLLTSCSAGGHVYELAQILPHISKFKVVSLVERSKAQVEVGVLDYSLPYDSGGNRLRAVMCVLYGFLVALWVGIRYKPKYHLSLGSHASIGPTIAMWILRIDTIHIESYTRVKELSKSGKVIKKFAKYFYVQWKHDTLAASSEIYEGALF